MNTYREQGHERTYERPHEGAHEGRVARAIERRTARIPSDAFLWAAGAALVGSLALEIVGISRGNIRGMRERAPLASFVGLWVPTLLLFGIYNKIVKVAGSDRYED